MTENQDSEDNHFSEELDNFDDLLGISEEASIYNSIHRESMKSSVVDLLISKNLDPKNKNLKNLYQNIGSKVSKLRELNDLYIQKISNQKKSLFVYEERLAEKMDYLEKLRQAKLRNDKEYFNKEYKELLAKNKIDLKIHYNHILYDAERKKIYEENEKEISNLRNKCNNLLDESKNIKESINLFRIENNKLQLNLKKIVDEKSEKTKKMEALSKEVNIYLKEKDLVNRQILELNLKIEDLKDNHQSKIFEIKHMIENTKKIKQLQENIALEKFSQSKNFNKKNLEVKNEEKADTNKKHNNKIDEEQIKLDKLNDDLSKNKSLVAYYNFSKFIYFKKQQKLSKKISNVKRETGCQNLDKLSENLAVSTKTNDLFKVDLKNLQEEKDQIEKKIEELKNKLSNSRCLLNDTSSKKFEYIEKLKVDIGKEEKLIEMLNKKYYNLNRIIDILSTVFKKIYGEVSYNDSNKEIYGMVNFFFFFLYYFFLIIFCLFLFVFIPLFF